MIPLPAGVQVWLATGHTDMRKGFDGLALLVQETLNRLAKLGEDVTEKLEVVPRQWKVVQIVREKFSCRDCEKISQAPAPFHVLPRGFAGPSLLAMIVFEKYGQHQPLNRQSERYAREGIDLSVSTLADQVGGCAVLLRPLYELIRAHVFAGDRLHCDETTVPVLAKHQTHTARHTIAEHRYLQGGAETLGY